MTADEIKQKLKDLEITQSDLAREWKKSPSAICLVINRKIKSAEIEVKLARRIGVAVEKLRAVPTPAETLNELEQLTEQATGLISSMKNAIDGEDN